VKEEDAHDEKIKQLNSQQLMKELIKSDHVKALILNND
jgi:hypothetical protein